MFEVSIGGDGGGIGLRRGQGSALTVFVQTHRLGEQALLEADGRLDKIGERSGWRGVFQLRHALGGSHSMQVAPVQAEKLRFVEQQEAA